MTFDRLVCRMSFLRFGHCFLGILWIAESAMARNSRVRITYVRDSVIRGAVCLDGTPPAYHLDRGFGSGANNWLIQVEGGGWCNNVTTCLARKNMRLGSSEQMMKEIPFSGILNSMQRFNPDFYNWNRVKVRYCDGASFTGDVEAVNPVTNLHFRGARIWTAVIKDLLYRGMGNAKNAILSGCSAGGLTAILHCDGFRALLPVGARVKCISDAGYFINVRDISGERHIESFFDQVVETHGSTDHLPQFCTSRIKPGLCFFPQYVTRKIKTPLFILNAAYDSWQIRNILAPVAADPEGIWDSCKLDIDNCSLDQLRIMQEFRHELLYSLGRLGRSTKRGLFVDSCYAHCQSELQETWLWGDSPELSNKSIAKAVGDWFYDRSPFQKIDCPFPCNPTCTNRGHTIPQTRNITVKPIRG